MSRMVRIFVVTNSIAAFLSFIVAFFKAASIETLIGETGAILLFAFITVALFLAANVVAYSVTCSSFKRGT